MFFLLCYGGGISQTQKAIASPLEVVNQRMDHYNHHYFEKFINLYSDSVRVYTYPDIFLASGKDNLESIFKPKFSSKSIQVKIITQITNGNYVVNQELVTESGVDTKYVSIYEVRDGLITTVRFIRDY